MGDRLPSLPTQAGPAVVGSRRRSAPSDLTTRSGSAIVHITRVDQTLSRVPLGGSRRAPQPWVVTGASSNTCESGLYTSRKEVDSGRGGGLGAEDPKAPAAAPPRFSMVIRVPIPEDAAAGVGGNLDVTPPEPGFRRRRGRW